MLCRIILLLLLQVVTLLVVGETSGKITVEQRMWFADISASGRYVSPASLNLPDVVFEPSGKILSNGSGNLDLQKDLGFKGSNIPQTRLIWAITPAHTIRMDYFATKFAGQTDVTAKVPVGMFTVPVKSHIEENLAMKYWKIGWINYGNSHVDDKIRLGILLDIKTVSLASGINGVLDTDSGSPITLSKPITFSNNFDFKVTAPTIGFVITGKPDKRLNYFIECAGFTNGKNGFLFADYEASLQWFVAPKQHTSIVVGYHVINYENYQKAEKSKLASVRIGGFFYGLQSKF